MLPPKAVDLARRLYEAEVRARNALLARGISSIKENATKHGMLLSGRTVLLITEECKRELGARAVLAWDAIQRVLSEIGLSLDATLPNELKSAMTTFLEEAQSDLEDRLRREVEPLQMGWDSTALWNERRALEEGFGAQVDLFVAGLQRRAPQTITPGATPVVNNFYAPVGAVQTAPHSIASVVQNISATEQRAVLEALSAVEHALAALVDVSGVAPKEVVEVIADVRNEVQRPRPNRLRLTQLASGLATTIQTLGSMRPAYDLLKAALAPLGILLP